jgi:uncharacterized cupin superfamily protein
MPLGGYYSAAPSRAELLRSAIKMSRLELPAVDPTTVTEKRGSGYPEPFQSRMGDRVKRRLGDACGLTKFGVNLVTLAVGAQSALRHWHTLEDEFVYILAGEVTLVTDAGEQTLGPGMCAGYPAGKRDAHHFINRGSVPASYLEIGNRIDGDKCFYPDDDLIWCDDGNGEYGAHRDGRRYEK